MQILKILKKEYSSRKTELMHKNPWELLVATVLSAQCTDKRVNMITPKLFEKFSTAKDMAKAKVEVVEKLIYSTGFYKNKAKNIIASAKMIMQNFGGNVPSKMEDLLKLPGVARKTANIVLAHGFGKVEGIAVDTHVKRVAFRLGFTKEKDPKKIEKDLMNLFCKKDWGIINHVLIDHGRKICKARKPMCAECVVRKNCRSATNAPRGSIN